MSRAAAGEAAGSCEPNETLVEVIESALSLRSGGDGIARRLAPVALAAAIGVTVFLKMPICSIAFGLGVREGAAILASEY